MTIHFLAQAASDTATTVPHHHYKKALLLVVYGLFLLGGGIIGFVKAKSLPSLIAGGISGIIAIVLGVLAIIANYSWIPYAALVLALLLTGMMTKRYLDTKKAMPAVPIVAFSLVVAILQVYVVLRSYK